MNHRNLVLLIGALALSLVCGASAIAGEENSKPSAAPSPAAVQNPAGMQNPAAAAGPAGAPNSAAAPNPGAAPGPAAAPSPAALPKPPAEAKPAGGGRLTIEKPIVDLGEVGRGQVATAVFELRNTGTEVLKILDARPG